MAETYAPVPGYETADYTDDQAVCITSDKKIGSMAGQISIQGEANSQYILYEMDRYHDGVDLSDKLLQVHYERRDGTGGNSTPVNVCASDSRLRFGWIVPGSATTLDGTLKVMPFATGLSPMGDTYIIKTLYAEYKVHKGLAVSGGIEEPDEDWYSAFVGRVAQYMETAKAYAGLAAGYERNAAEYRDQAQRMAGASAASAAEARQSAVSAAESAQAIEDRESEAASFAGQSKSYAVGTGGEVRENDDLDCAKSYYERSKQIAENLEEGSLTLDIDIQTPTFEEAPERENIGSGETISTILGKAKKFFSDLKAVAFSGSYNDLTDTPDAVSGATADAEGKAGLVPAPAAGEQEKFLCGDGTWKDTPTSRGEKGEMGETGATGATGPKGEDGAAAGFGTPMATIDANVGTPLVTITASGPDTAKVFSFEFKNLKGETGGTGATGPQGPKGADGKNAIASSQTVQLSTVWSGESAPYTQTVTVPGVTASSIVLIDVADNVTAEQMEAYINAKIAGGGQTTGSMTLRAFGDRPEVAVPIKILIMGV